jgi:hypothetical protein
MPDVQTNGWAEWGKHVLAELERLNNVCDKLEDTLSQMTIEMTKLKMRATFYGSIGGIVFSIIAGLVIKNM